MPDVTPLTDSVTLIPDNLLAENGDFLITEGGDNFITESTSTNAVVSDVVDALTVSMTSAAVRTPRSITGTATDALATAEAATATKGAVSLSRTATDAISTSEAATGTRTPLSVTGTATDALVTSMTAAAIRTPLSVTRTASDALTTAEAITDIGNFIRIGGDTITTSESVTATKFAFVVRSASDAVTTAEAVARIGSFKRGITEATTTAEAAVATKFAFIVRTTVDAVTTSDAANRVGSFHPATIDAISTGEAIAKVASHPRSATDALATAEAVTAVKVGGGAFTRTATEALSTAESAGRGVMSFVRSATDSLSSAHVVSGNKTKAAVATDALSTSDAATRIGSFHPKPVDVLSTNEFVIGSKFALVSRTASESLTATEAGALGYINALTVQAGQVPSTQTDFPVTVNLTDTRLRTVGNGGHVLRTDGYDIGFYADASKTTKLKWEIERYNPLTGELVAHVKISSLSNGTVFYLGYGDPTITTNQADPVSVWSNGFVAVYHLSDSTTLPNDSKGAWNLTNGGVTAGTGQIGGGGVFAATYLSRGVTGAPVTAMPLTLSCWAKPTGGMGATVAMGISHASSWNAWYLYWNDAGSISAGSAENTNFTGAIQTATANVWQHWAVVFASGTSRTAFVNGVGGATDTTSSTPAFTPNDSAVGTVVSNSSAAVPFYGLLDEARVSNVARSADWLLTEYNNGIAPTTFLSLGAEGVVSGGAIRILQVSRATTEALSTAEVAGRVAQSISRTATEALVASDQGIQGYYDALTVQSGQVPSTQTNFPVLVSITDARLKTVANGGHVQRADGFDIGFFADTAGATPLKWEINRYDPATGQLIAYVKIASLSDGAVFYLRYGESAITTDRSDPANVWDANFRQVLHLGDGATLSLVDSKGINNGNTGGATAVAGRVGGAAELTSGSYIVCTTPINTTVSTVAVWAKMLALPTSGNNNNLIGLIDGLNSGVHERQLGVNATGQFEMYAWDGGLHLLTGPTPTIGAWYRLVGVQDGSVATFYVNGTVVGSTACGAGYASYTQPNLFLGGYSAGGALMNAVLDESQFSDIARSANWITTDYNNQSNPGAFLSLGSENIIPGAGGAIAVVRTGVVRTATDALATSEVISKSATHPRTATDNPATAEAATKAGVRSRTATDALTTSEAITKAATHSRTATDAATTTDAPTRSIVVGGVAISRTATESLSAVESIPGLSNGATVDTWPDSSGNARDAVRSAGSPQFNTASTGNGKPSVLFQGGLLDGPNSVFTGLSGGTVTVFIVIKNNSLGGSAFASYPDGGGGSNRLNAHLPWTDTNVYWDFGNAAGAGRIYTWYGGDLTNFHVWTFTASGGVMAIYRDGAAWIGPSAGYSNVFDPSTFILSIGGGTWPTNSYIASFALYNTALGTDRANVEKFLGDAYGVTVAGGTAVDPTTLSGLNFYLKSESLLGSPGAIAVVKPAIVRTATNALTISEAVLATKTGVVTRTATDALVTSEVAVRNVAKPRTASDNLVVSEAATKSATHPRTATDSVATADATTKSATHPRTATDALVVAEVASRTTIQTRTTTDALVIAETVTSIRTGSGVFARSTTETLTVGMVAAWNLTALRAAADALATAEAASRAVPRSRTTTETLSATVAAVAVRSTASVTRTATETLSTTELVAASKFGLVTRTATDALTANLVANRVLAVGRTASESLTAALAANRRWVGARIATDMLTAVDSAGAEGTAFLFIAGQVAGSTPYVTSADSSIRISSTNSDLEATVAGSNVKAPRTGSGLKVEKTNGYHTY